MQVSVVLDFEIEVDQQLGELWRSFMKSRESLLKDNRYSARWSMWVRGGEREDGLHLYRG